MVAYFLMVVLRGKGDLYCEFMVLKLYLWEFYKDLNCVLLEEFSLSFYQESGVL